MTDRVSNERPRCQALSDLCTLAETREDPTRKQARSWPALSTRHPIAILRIYTVWLVEANVSETTVIIRVEQKLKNAFTRAAKAADRTASQLLRDFMRDYVRRQEEQAEYDAWLRQKVEAGRAAIREGRVKPSEEVETIFAERRAASLRKADETGS